MQSKLKKKKKECQIGHSLSKGDEEQQKQCSGPTGRSTIEKVQVSTTESQMKV